MYFKGEPLYPFGHGMSYTTFVYSRPRVPAVIPADGSVTVSFDLRNTGERAGEEVVQMYVRHLDSKVARPRKELKGFARVGLNPGESKTVSLTLKAEQLAYWDESQHRFVTEDDTVQIQICSTSTDIRLARSARVVTNARVIR